MKKSLIAIAALAAAGAASAQSSVTLYGIIDTNFAYTKHVYNAQDAAGVDLVRDTKTGTGFGTGMLNGSRWGLKGQEDLGTGLAAVFDLQAGFNSANGTFNTGFNRRSVVGLKGAFGEVLVGRDSTPVNNWMGPYDADDDSGVSPVNDVANVIVARATGIFYNGNFSGVGINAYAGRTGDKTTSFGVTTTDTVDWGLGLGVSYAYGPFAVGGAYQQHRSSSSGTTTSKQDDYGIGASYDFGAAKLFTSYAGSKHTNSVVGAYSKLDQANVGVLVPFGAASFVASYGHNWVKSNGMTPLVGSLVPTTGWGTVRTKGSGNDFMVGANYAFSKRTDAYVRASRYGDVDSKVYDNTTDAYVGKFKANSTAFAVGVRHRF